jgi:hypothetical protein
MQITVNQVKNRSGYVCVQVMTGPVVIENP